MSYHATEFKKLNNEFSYAAKPILDGTVSTIESLQYLLDCYNAIIVYSIVDYDNKKKSTKEHIQNTIEVNRITLRRCYEKLNIPITLPGKLFSTIHYCQHEDNSNQNKNIVPHPEQDTQTTGTQTIQNLQSTSSQTAEANMDAPAFLKLCGSTINQSYSGDPLALKSFVNSINLLKSIDPTKANILKLFVQAKLIGKALECVRSDPASVDEIIADLEKYIKPDNSKVIEGRMQALRFSSNRAQEFTEQAEKLADALQRTLKIEGMTPEKAMEETVDRTVDMCRQSAHTDFIRSVLASTTFATPKDVLAKFVIESSKEKTEKQILTMRSQNNRTNNFQNRNVNGRGRGNFNRNRQNNQNAPRYNNFRNNRGNNRNYQSFQRGRGGNRSNFNNFNNDRYIRMMAENYHGPPNGRAEPEGAQAAPVMRLHAPQNNQ